MIIDEDKLITQFRLTKKDVETKEVYTDHNAMISDIKWEGDWKREEKAKNMTQQEYKEFAGKFKK